MKATLWAHATTQFAVLNQARKAVSTVPTAKRRQYHADHPRPQPAAEYLAQSSRVTPLLPFPSVPCLDMGLQHAKTFPKVAMGRAYRHHGHARYLARHFTRGVLDPDKLMVSVTVLEIKKFLRQTSLDFQESHACLAITLPKHILSEREEAPPSQWKALEESLTQLYVNKTTGEFVCPELALSGDWQTLRHFLSVWHKNKALKKGELPEPLPELKKLNLDAPAEALDLWSRSDPVETLDVREFKDLLKMFRLPLRELKIEDFSRYDVRVNTERNELIFPVRFIVGSRTCLLGLRRLRLCDETNLIIEENVPDARNTQVAEGRIFPFPHGLDVAERSHARSVILVTSVLDSVVVSSRTNFIPVALAEGASHLPPDHLPFFEKFEKVSLWFPNDTSSFDSARTFAKKLGDKRCHMVGREFENPIAAVRKKENISDVLKYRLRPCCHEYITTFESLREDVFLEMAHYEEVEGLKWRRFEPLNELIRGFRRGELTVFTGKTGSGKTTFMSEYSLDLCMQGTNTLWGSFEVANVRLAKMQLKQFSAVNLEEHIDQFDHWADRFLKLPMYYLTFHGAQEVDKVMDAMGHAVYIYDIAHVVIDNVQFMMGTSMKHLDRFFLQDIIIQKFRKFATLHNVHVTLVIHPRKEADERLTANSVFGGAKATQEADNVIILQEEEINLKLKRKFLQIVKNRFSGDIGIVPLFFNKGTSTYSKKIFQREKTLARKRRESPKVDELSLHLDEADNPPNEILIPPDNVQ